MLLVLADAFKENMFAEFVPELVAVSFLGPDPNAATVSAVESDGTADEESSGSSKTLAVVFAVCCVALVLKVLVCIAFPSGTQKSAFETFILNRKRVRHKPLLANDRSTMEDDDTDKHCAALETDQVHADVEREEDGTGNALCGTHEEPIGLDSNNRDSSNGGDGNLTSSRGRSRRRRSSPGHNGLSYLKTLEEDCATSEFECAVPDQATTSTLPEEQQQEREVVCGMHWADHSKTGTYTGEVNERKVPHGMGSMRCNDGSVAEGMWKNGELTDDDESESEDGATLLLQWCVGEHET